MVKGTSKDGKSPTYVVRLLSGDKPAMSIMLAGPSPDASAIKAFDALATKYGEMVFLDNELAGDALFSFSDA